MAIQKYADDGFSRDLGNMLDQRIAALQPFIDNGEPIPRFELTDLVWRTVKKIRDLIKPEKGTANTTAWTNAKGMLKNIIDFNKFSAIHEDHACVADVLENQVLSELIRYKTFVQTGEVVTKHPPPKLLGETDEILCIDKPCRYLCQYGDREKKCPQLSGATTPSQLLNSVREEIQIHEYIALKYDFETAVRTREFWKLGLTEMTCICGKCETCAATQTGCCNRLDKETSGIMVCAKTLKGFREIRNQFASEHSLEEGGTEKYYLALVHGEVILPSKPIVKSAAHWNLTAEVNPKGNDRGRIQADCVWDKNNGRAAPYDDGTGCKAEWDDKKVNSQWTLTFYEPVAYFKGKEKGDLFTLLKLQIITGRRHQIRFHAQQIGHVLVGDPKYDSKCYEDRAWCPRVFLHSYLTKFREPYTERWFEACSPLPQDLCEMIEKNMTLTRVVPSREPPLKSRRKHKAFEGFMVQYNPDHPLLITHDAPKVNPAKLLLIKAANDAANEQNGKRRRIIVPPQFANEEPRTPPLPNSQQPVVAQPAAQQMAPQVMAPQIAPQATMVMAPQVMAPQATAAQPVAAFQPAAPQVAAAPAAGSGWTRVASRSQAGVFYYWHAATGQSSVVPPPPWEHKASRSNPNVKYWFNALTMQTSVDMPDVV